jgi:hypothetical protein
LAVFLNPGRFRPILAYDQTVFSMIARTLLLSMTLMLGGCDLIDQLLADPKAIQKEADAKAIGSACRYGMRSIEDCYTMNEKASKSSVFTGWKEMDQYMRENKIEGVESKVTKAETPGPVAADEQVVSEPAKGKKDTADAKTKLKPKAADKAEPTAH